MIQQDLFSPPAGPSVAIALERSPLCPYDRHCGQKAAIGPCQPVSEACCNHDITCIACGKSGTESWNLEVGGLEHAKARRSTGA